MSVFLRQCPIASEMLPTSETSGLVLSLMTTFCTLKSFANWSLLISPMWPKRKISSVSFPVFQRMRVIECSIQQHKRLLDGFLSNNTSLLHSFKSEDEWTVHELNPKWTLSVHLCSLNNQNSWTVHESVDLAQKYGRVGSGGTIPPFRGHPVGEGALHSRIVFGKSLFQSMPYSKSVWCSYHNFWCFIYQNILSNFGKSVN